MNWNVATLAHLSIMTHHFEQTNDEQAKSLLDTFIWVRVPDSVMVSLWVAEIGPGYVNIHRFIWSTDLKYSTIYTAVKNQRLYWSLKYDPECHHEAISQKRMRMIPMNEELRSVALEIV